MYLTNKRGYLYLYESYRDENGKSRTRQVKSYGREDLIDPATLEKLYKEYGNKRLNQKLKQQQNLDSYASLVDVASEDNKEFFTNFNKSPLLHYGHLLVKPLIEEEMGLRYKLDYLQRTDSKITSYQVSDIAFYAIASKLLDPASYLGSYAKQTTFLSNPVEGIALDNFYAALDFLSDHKDEILKHVVKKVHTTKSDGPQLLFYDCTNCYYETPYDDVEQFTFKYIAKTRYKLEDKGFTQEQVQEYLESEDFKFELETVIKEHEDELVRRRGPSKESRFAQPIVSIALVIDEQGIPMDFEIYKGNSSEFKTMAKSIEKLQKKFNVKNSYIVADRGLNSTDNLNMLLNKQLGFVVAQKVSNLSKDLEKQMLNLDDYQTTMVPGVDIDSPETMVKYKVCETTKTAYSVDETTGKRQKVTVNCNIMFTFSEKRKKRDLAELNDDLVKAQNAVNEGKLMANPCSSGWRGIVKTQKEAEDGKTDKSLYKAKEINLAVVEHRKAIAGFAAMVYSDPVNEDDSGSTATTTTITPQMVLTTYHHLVKIEDCFRVMKTNFSIRPMFVRLESHIRAHCLICVLALIALRVLENKMKALGHNYSVHQLTQELNNAVVAPIPVPNSKDMLFMNCKFFSDIYTKDHVKKNRTKADVNDLLDLAEIESAYTKAQEQQSDCIDSIIKALGLSPLPLVSNVGQIKKALKFRTAKTNLIDQVVNKCFKNAVSDYSK